MPLQYMTAPAPQGPGLDKAEPSVKITTSSPALQIRSIASWRALSAYSFVRVPALPKSRSNASKMGGLCRTFLMSSFLERSMSCGLKSRRYLHAALNFETGVSTEVLQLLDCSSSKHRLTSMLSLSDWGLRSILTLLTSCISWEPIRREKSIVRARGKDA